MTDVFLRFISSDMGRLTRVSVGASLLTWGLMSFGTVAGTVVSLLALAPLLTGFSNRCILPPPSDQRAPTLR